MFDIVTHVLISLGDTAINVIGASIDMVGDLAARPFIKAQNESDKILLRYAKDNYIERMKFAPDSKILKNYCIDGVLNTVPDSLIDQFKNVNPGEWWFYYLISEANENNESLLEEFIQCQIEDSNIYSITDNKVFAPYAVEVNSISFFGKAFILEHIDGLKEFLLKLQSNTLTEHQTLYFNEIKNYIYDSDCHRSTCGYPLSKREEPIVEVRRGLFEFRDIDSTVERLRWLRSIGLFDEFVRYGYEEPDGVFVINATPDEIKERVKMHMKMVRDNISTINHLKVVEYRYQAILAEQERIFQTQSFFEKWRWSRIMKVWKYGKLESAVYPYSNVILRFEDYYAMKGKIDYVKQVYRNYMRTLIDNGIDYRQASKQYSEH